MLAVSVRSFDLCCDVYTLCTCWEFDRHHLIQIGYIPILPQAPSELLSVYYTYIYIHPPHPYYLGTSQYSRTHHDIPLTTTTSRYRAWRH